ncbi:MAG: NADH-quinone oxidoreductase subunit C [Myxococcales bacterium]
MSKAVLDALVAKFPAAVRDPYSFHGDDACFVEAAAVIEVGSFLKYEAAMDMKLLLSVTAVDYLGEAPRFEVVYHLTSLTHHHRVRLRAKVPETPAEIPSVAGIWRTANWWERHVWDMYGIRFTGHPDLKRLYMPEEWQGHPLRKDYPLRGRQPVERERGIPDLIRGPGPQPRDEGKLFPGRSPRR